MDQAEHRLSHWVDTFLERVMVEPCWFTAVDTGTIMVNASPQARMNWQAKRKAMGIKPHHLDWYVYQRPLFAQFELKVGTNDATPGQAATRIALARHAIPTEVCWSVPQVHAFLVKAGFRLHENALNIALEIHERVGASNDAAALKKGKPKPKARVVQAKPSRAQIEKTNKMRSRVMF